MMYSEFAEATGCKDNEANHRLFRNLEIMYMEGDMSKAEIYAIGRAFMDNSKSEQQLQLEKEINDEIARYKMEIKELERDIEWRKEALMEEMKPEYKALWKSEIKWRRNQIKQNRNQIKALKWVLG